MGVQGNEMVRRLQVHLSFIFFAALLSNLRFEKRCIVQRQMHCKGVSALCKDRCTCSRREQDHRSIEEDALAAKSFD